MSVDARREGAILTLTLNGFGAANRLSTATFGDLRQHFAAFEADSDLAVAILRGADGEFCAGLDRPAQDSRVPPEDWLAAVWQPDAVTAALAPLLAGVVQPPLKPVVAAIRGRCMDPGLLALGAYTSIRIAGSSASFGFSELLGTGAVVRSHLRHQVARTTSMWLASGGVLSAAAALRAGLVTEVTADDRVLSRADEVARQIAKIAPRAIRIEMTALNCTRGLPQPQVAATCQLFSTLGRFDPSTLAGLVGFFQQHAPKPAT